MTELQKLMARYIDAVWHYQSSRTLWKSEGWQAVHKRDVDEASFELRVLKNLLARAYALRRAIMSRGIFVPPFDVYWRELQSWQKGLPYDKSKRWPKA